MDAVMELGRVSEETKGYSAGLDGGDATPGDGLHL